MATLIAVAGFLGAWALVAGPVYQAAIEHGAERLDREAIAAADDSVPPRAAVSRWWWLLPPVALLLRRRAMEEHRQAVMRVMWPVEVAQLLGFGAKVTGWLTVALGAGLIGVKETWELTERLDWPGWAFAGLLVLALSAAVSFGPLRLRRDRRVMALHPQDAGPAEAAPGSGLQA